MTALVSAELYGMTNVVPLTPYKRACSHCGKPATRLCDHRPYGGGLPCDALICDECASAGPEPNRDHCPYHAKVWRDRQELRATAHQGAA